MGDKVEVQVSLSLVVGGDDVARLAESLERDKLAMHLTNALMYSCGVKQVQLRKVGLDFKLDDVKNG